MASTYFITASAYMKQNIFQTSANVELLVKTLLRYRDAGEFLVHDFVVMPNHIHILISLCGNCTLERAVQLVKGGYSHALRKSGMMRKAIWQPSYYDRRVRDAEECERISTYIRHNPVRGGLVEAPEHYRYSSASGCYATDEVPQWLKPVLISNL